MTSQPLIPLRVEHSGCTLSIALDPLPLLPFLGYAWNLFGKGGAGYAATGGGAESQR
jgi:hypothetical protein